MRAAHKWWNLLILVNAAKAKTLILEARLDRELQVGSFFLESDYLQVIIVAKRGGNPLCDFGKILKDVVREANDLNICGFCHFLLGGNVLAYVLAKMAISYKSFALWKEVVPLCVS